MASDPQQGTEELDDTLLETVIYHNREFQLYSIDNSVYFAPVDEDETERLNIQHNVLKLVFDGRLIFPPLSHPRRILECGFGAASWAIEVAERHPSCEVVGVDISPHMKPDDIPSNLFLQVDDLNRRFTFRENSFDLVHSQLVAGGINANRWPTYLRDVYRAVRPGGWVQLTEIYHQAQSFNGTLTESHALRKWSTRYFESLQGLKNLRIALQLKDALRDAGFEEVEQTMIRLPTCEWSEVPVEKEIGRANRENVQRFLSSLAVYPFTEKLGMTISDVQLLIGLARNEADHPAFKAYFPLYICCGRKPERRSVRRR